MQIRAGQKITLDQLYWPNIVKPGATVVWGQTAAEPVSLTKALMQQRASIGRFRAFVGISWSDSVAPAHSDYVDFASYCGSGTNRALGDALTILPIPYSDIAPTLAGSSPIVLLSLAPGQDETHFSLGAGCDYLLDLLEHASLVIAEVSGQYPVNVSEGNTIARECIDLVIYTESKPPVTQDVVYGLVEQQIATQVADLIEDGSTLQIGLGGIPTAVLSALTNHRDLGVHSGLIVDEVADLAESGVINNAKKTIDQGKTVTGLLAGSQRLMGWAENNASLALRPTSYTHAPEVLASIDQLVAINSAIEVDLTGQVNAEVAGGRYVGAVGGAAAFLRGAHASRGGLPIIALPSTVKDKSRIVTELSGPVSTARSDAGIIVTEQGVADLRGLSIKARRERMLAIANPDHVEALEQEMGRDH